ncbi:MAG: tRNA preQ1(34) S-adenosylmethionine ribosyltransferase-isomerase QueA [Planctomycetes bacterium]|nr:tRNA preQ1(34) S-adenosylmethionine ribosyltransferase-isomerase QueA [Planctomycetota bacterium]
MLRTSELEYDLPEDRIALEPATPRDAARLMVVDRPTGRWRDDARVSQLPGLLRSGDLIVFNTTRVIPARLLGRREDTGGQVEGLFLARTTDRPGEHWTVLLRAKKVRPGMRFVLDRPDGTGPGSVHLQAVERVDGEPGAWVVAVEDQAPGEALGHAGHTPLPPYILKAREHAHLQVAETTDRDRYQTVYAREPGSVAAPTAGLHFTPELLAALASMGVQRADVTLHVGTGTFRPVEADVVESHPMHTEYCEMAPETVRIVLAARREGRRVIAVGTTTARTLESYAAAWEALLQQGLSETEALARLPQGLDTKLLITPGYQWRWVSGLMTNFHLPRSTLLAMVGAFLAPGSAEGLRDLKALYARAIDTGYRFYSYGDAMLIL